MLTKKPVKRTLTADEKLIAINRVSLGGESKASVARDLGIPESTLRGWCKNQDKISYQVRTSPSNVYVSDEIASTPSKRARWMEEQPYNLSFKSEVSKSLSPNSEDEKRVPECSQDKMSRLVMNRPELCSSFNNPTETAAWLGYRNAYEATQTPTKETGLLTTVDQRDRLLPRLEQPSVHDSVSNWLKQQSLDSRASVANGATTSYTQLWNLYQQSYQQTTSSASESRQLAKEGSKESENQMSKEENNTNNNIESAPKVDVVAQAEAIEQGERFLNWLEDCSNPSVTSMQLQTMQILMKNLKNSLVRKIASQYGSKVKRE